MMNARHWVVSWTPASILLPSRKWMQGIVWWAEHQPAFYFLPGNECKALCGELNTSQYFTSFQEMNARHCVVSWTPSSILLPSRKWMQSIVWWAEHQPAFYFQPGSGHECSLWCPTYAWLHHQMPCNTMGWLLVKHKCCYDWNLECFVQTTWKQLLQKIVKHTKSEVIRQCFLTDGIVRILGGGEGNYAMADNSFRYFVLDILPSWLDYVFTNHHAELKKSLKKLVRLVKGHLQYRLLPFFLKYLKTIFVHVSSIVFLLLLFKFCVL